MLSSRAVKKFRNRPRDSFDFMKKLTRMQLLRMVYELDPQPEFISPHKMWNHQLAAFLIGVYMPHFLFFIDMGGGKTRVILELIAYRKLCGDDRGALVVTVDDVNIENWVMEAEVHCPDLHVVPMYGSTADRYELLEEGADLYVAHYAALYHLCSYIPKPRTPKKQKGGKKRKISKARINRVVKNLNAITLDECTKIMHKDSLTFRTCNRVGNELEYRYGLAALPHGRDPTALWSQFYYCDHGETLGEVVQLFRQSLFKPKMNRFTGWPTWHFDKRKWKELHRMMKHRSITYDESEFRNVPKTIDKKVYVHFTDDMRAYYNRIVEQVKKDTNDKRLIRNSFMHMRQIGSGFIGLIDDETGERAQVEFPHNPKIEAMRSIIEDLIDDDRRFLIYHQYTWTGDRIARELEAMKVPFLRLRGGQKKGVNPGILREFRKSSKYPGLVVQNQVGAYGLNLQVASAEIYIESPTSPIDREQAQKRIRPALNPRRCMFFDVIMKDNSADENIQNFLKEGRDLQSAIMKGRNVFKKIRRV